MPMNRLHPISEIILCNIRGVQVLYPPPINNSQRGTYMESDIGLYLSDRNRVGLPDVHLGLLGLGLEFAQPDLRV